MKEIFPGLIKNGRLKDALSDKLSHAYIIEGRRGSGRMTAVKSCAAAALCENKGDSSLPLPCGNCSVCSRIARGIHPDFMEFSSGSKKSIGVDVAREIRSQVFISPVESEYKFFVIRDADLMTPEAQNALLISIEEPPPFSVFFLIVTDKSMLLETIRSRCVTLSTEKLDDGTVAEYLKTTPAGEKLSASNPNKFSEVVKTADGALGVAIELLSGESAEDSDAHNTAMNLVSTVLKGTAGDKVKLAVTFPKTRDSQDKIYSLGILAVRDIISVKMKTDSELMFYSDMADTARFTDVPLRRLMAFYTVLEDGRVSLAGNLSPTLTAEHIIMLKF